MQFCKGERGGGGERRKYGATRGLGKKGESAISSRTANLCSLGCIFVLPIQRGSSSLFDLGPASRKRPRSFLGHVDWAFPPTRCSATATDWDATAQRSRTVNSHSLHCVHVCLGQPECTINCRMGTKTGSGLYLGRFPSEKQPEGDLVGSRVKMPYQCRGERQRPAVDIETGMTMTQGRQILARDAEPECLECF